MKGIGFICFLLFSKPSVLFSKIEAEMVQILKERFGKGIIMHPSIIQNRCVCGWVGGGNWEKFYISSCVSLLQMLADKTFARTFEFDFELSYHVVGSRILLVGHS